ncbi:S-layer homology domain-containing protein [Paenibacillus sp. strain BS8-2]
MAVFNRQVKIVLSMLLIMSLWLPGSILANDVPAFSMKALNLGGKLVVEVKGHQLSDVYAFQFNLDYDESTLKFIEASSPISGFTVDPVAKNGSVLFAHSKVGNTKGTKGDAVLATFTFERQSTTTSLLDLHSIKWVNSELDMVELGTKVVLSSAYVQYTDIAGHWAEASILKASEQGWITGYEDGTFRPQRQVTRAEFVAMLVRALDLPIPSPPQPSFADHGSIPQWAIGYAAAAKEAGLVEGYADGNFQGNKPISRTEMAVLIVRAEGVKPRLGGLLQFVDTEQIPAWARPYIAEAVERGWVKGVGGNRFAPLAQATRAESAHLILTILTEE